MLCFMYVIVRYISMSSIISALIPVSIKNSQLISAVVKGALINILR